MAACPTARCLGESAVVNLVAGGERVSARNRFIPVGDLAPDEREGICHCGRAARPGKIASSFDDERVGATAVKIAFRPTNDRLWKDTS